MSPVSPRPMLAAEVAADLLRFRAFDRASAERNSSGASSKSEDEPSELSRSGEASRVICAVLSGVRPLFAYAHEWQLAPFIIASESASTSEWPCALSNWLVRELSPLALSAAGLTNFSSTLRDLDPIRDPLSARIGAPLVARISREIHEEIDLRLPHSGTPGADSVVAAAAASLWAVHRSYPSFISEDNPLGADLKTLEQSLKRALRMIEFTGVPKLVTRAMTLELLARITEPPAAGTNNLQK